MGRIRGVSDHFPSLFSRRSGLSLCCLIYPNKMLKMVHVLRCLLSFSFRLKSSCTPLHTLHQSRLIKKPFLHISHTDIAVTLLTGIRGHLLDRNTTNAKRSLYTFNTLRWRCRHRRHEDSGAWAQRRDRWHHWSFSHAVSRHRAWCIVFGRNERCVACRKRWQRRALHVRTGAEDVCCC